MPWVIWIWNLGITKDELLEQLNFLLSQGFGGIAIRPGRDMSPSYLSEEFFELFGIVLQAAQQKNVGIRIADDFSLPWSGFFDEIVSHSKKLRAQKIVLRETIETAGQSEITINKVDSDTVALAVRFKDGVPNSNDIKVLSGKIIKDSLVWKVTPGEWKVLVFQKQFVTDPVGCFIPNVYNPKTSLTYIQTVLEQFKTRFSKFIPGTFEGFINEMPAIRPADNSIPWDDDLAVKFKTKYKKDLTKLLPLLFFENCPGSARIRQQIYAFISQSMYEKFASPLEAWAKKSRLSQWVLCAERSINKTENELVDGFIPVDQGLSSAGIQNLDGTNASYPLLRMFADTNAIQYRRDLITCIGRNRNGSAATLQSLKNEVDLNLLGGPSKMIIDGAFFNVDQRSYIKTPFNPAWYSPGSENMKSLCAYISRANEICKDIHFTKQIAVLAPSVSALACYTPDKGEASRKSFSLLQKTLAALDRLNLSYDIVSEELLGSCTVRTNGEFGTTDRIRKGNYQALVVPFAPFVSRAVLALVEKLALKENRVFFIDEMPLGTLEDGTTAAVKTRIDKLADSKKLKAEIIPSGEIEDVLSAIDPVVNVNSNGKRGSDIFCSLGSGEGFELYILQNVSDTKDYYAEIAVPEQKYFAVADCESGELLEIEGVEKEAGQSHFKLSMAPKTTLYILGSSTRIASQGSSKNFRNGVNPFVLPVRGYRIVLKDQWAFETRSMNALPLANWSVRIGLSRESGGFSHFYETNFQVKSIPSSCFFVMNGIGGSQARFSGLDNSTEITVNGTRVDKMPAGTGFIPEIEKTETEAKTPAPSMFPIDLYDGAIKKVFGRQLIDIKDLLIRGFNRVSIRTSGLISDPQTIMYPPVVLGDFGISKGQNGWSIDKQENLIGHNSWTKYGYPYLSGVGVYKQAFEIPNEYEKIILRLSQVSGAVGVSLNDKSLGVFNWHPIEVDVTSIISTSKRNELTIETLNTIDNLVKLNGRPSGLTGEVYLDVY